MASTLWAQQSTADSIENRDFLQSSSRPPIDDLSAHRPMCQWKIWRGKLNHSLFHSQSPLRAEETTSEFPDSLICSTNLFMDLQLNETITIGQTLGVLFIKGVFVILSII